MSKLRFEEKSCLRNAKLNCEETHGNSLLESVLLLLVITCNLNQCRALYRFSNKSYYENRSNFGEIPHYHQIADAFVFSIDVQVLLRIP